MRKSTYRRSHVSRGTLTTIQGGRGGRLLFSFPIPLIPDLAMTSVTRSPGIVVSQ